MEPEPLAIGRPVEIRSAALAAAIVLIGVTAAVGSCCTAFERKRPRSSISCRTRRSGCGGWSKAMPMLMILKVVCDHIEDFKGVGELLGE